MAGKRTKQDNQGQQLPIYVIAGKDRRRIVDQANQLRDQLLGDADPQVTLSVYESNQAELADVLDDLRTLPFLAPLRLVMVKDADAFIRQYRSELEAYFDKPSATGVLMLLAESFPKSTRLAKIATKIGQVIYCDPLKPRELPAFVADYAQKSYNLKLGRPAAELLVDLVGDDSGMLLAEVDKLAAYLADPTSKTDQIKPELVQQLVGNNRQFNAFNVIDAMTTGQTAQALTQLDAMLSQDRTAQFTAVGAFAWHFRRLYNARILHDQRMGDREICKTLRIWGQPDAFMQQVRRLPLPRIAGVVEDLLQVDYASKTGGSVQMGLANLIVRFAGRQRR